MTEKVELIKEYLFKIKDSNKELTKKEIFKDLLNRLYSGSEEIVNIIDKMSLGAEAAIFNIPRKDKLHKGSADTLYNKIIIEFENNLKSSFNHAKEQLAGYLLGQFNSGEGYNFTLIVSDFITWKILAPDVSCLENIENLQENELILNEVESAAFILTEENASEFYYWIDRFLFKEEKQKATLKRIEESFGLNSHVFIESFRELNKWYYEAKKFGEVQVSYEQWEKFLSIAYGSFIGNDSFFLIHSYLSIFSKMLAFSVVSDHEFIHDDEMKQILDGNIFNNYNINNFVDNDFFFWVKEDRSFQNLKKVFRLIAQEISAYEFENVNEDILKGVYQELIDLDTRHALGEYYTPDWLCERIVNEYDFKISDKILDPSCGSGSFLRAAIHRLKDLNPGIDAEQLNNQIYGIDIHPLSVQITKTTMLLTLGKGIINAKKPVHLNIILANTLLSPDGIEDLFGNEFTLQIDKDKYQVNTQIFENIAIFDSILDICDELSTQTRNAKTINIENFTNIIKSQSNCNGFTRQTLESFYKIYLGLKKVKENGRDSIWKFIITNLYKPFFLAGRFDYVIGNPPWLTYSSVKNEEYQNILNKLAEKYNVKPAKTANFPHLEIAAIFLAHCSSFFLKDEGKLAFVLPRSFISADQHDNTRTGRSFGFRLTNIWDFAKVTPVFRIPNCVVFADKAFDESSRAITKKGLPGITFSGRMPVKNSDLKAVREKLHETGVKWYLIKQGGSTALSNNKQIKQLGLNPYKSKFKQGATIVPRAFYFVELTQLEPPDYEDRIINIKTSKSILNDAKKPWKGINFKGRIESKFLFRTALSKSILPFALYKPDLVALPVIIENNANNLKSLKIYKPEELMLMGNLKASSWFKDAERIWELSKTAKSKKMTAIGRVDYHKGLTAQNMNSPYLVLYNSSAKDANATVVKRSEIDFEFIVESVTYVFYSKNLRESYYLTSIINSTLPNLFMKDFQARGLFGARHVHKKILDVYFPEFDKNNPLHNELAKIGALCHKKAKQYLINNTPDHDLTPHYLGNLRQSIKNHLSREMKEIDDIVKKIISL